MSGAVHQNAFSPKFQLRVMPMTEDICDMLDLRADIGDIASAMAWLEIIGERDQWPPRLSFSLALGLDEALTNIVTYAFVDHPVVEPGIQLRVKSDGRQVSVQIVDNGVAFDPTKFPPAELATSLDDAEIGGHGMRLMLHYLDKIDYARIADRNQLTLLAILPPEPGPSA